MDFLNKDMIFDKRQTNIAKGIAVLLLLWHHLFFDTPEKYEMFTSMWMFHSVPIECIFARFCKVCVAIFVFLSGFGLYKSRQKSSEIIIRGGNYKAVHFSVSFVKNHLIKLMLNYWFIYIIFVPLGVFFNKKFWAVYDGNVIYGIIDVLGLADMFHTPTMNRTWWFMSVIILLYLLFPLLVKVLQWSPETMLIISIILMIFPHMSGTPYIGQYFDWFPPFVLGMFFADQNSFERIFKRNQSLQRESVLSLLLLLLAAYLRWYSGDTTKYDSIFALSIIMISYFVISRIPILSVVLEQLGKHSGAIFMFHTFIFSLYFKEFIYGFKYSPIIFIVLTVICYAVAVGLEYLKKLIRYDILMMRCNS